MHCSHSFSVAYFEVMKQQEVCSGARVQWEDDRSARITVPEVWEESYFSVWSLLGEHCRHVVFGGCQL